MITRDETERLCRSFNTLCPQPRWFESLMMFDPFSLVNTSWRTLRNHRGPFARLALIAKGRELSWQRCVRKVSKVIQSRRSWCVVRRTLLLRQIMLIMWITGLPYSVPSRFWKIKQDQANATFAEETPNDRIISPSCCERGMYIPNELYRWNQILLQCKCLTFSGWLLQKDYTKLDSAYEFMDTNTHKWSLLLPKVLHKTNWPRNCLHTNIGSDSDEPLHLSHQIGLFESCRVCLFFANLLAENIVPGVHLQPSLCLNANVPRQ